MSVLAKNGGVIGVDTSHNLRRLIEDQNGYTCTYVVHMDLSSVLAEKGDVRRVDTRSQPSSQKTY